MRVPSAHPASPPPGELLGHPRGLYLLFFTEMWERMSYYGMRGLLVLFLTDATSRRLWLVQGDALILYGSYTGLVYLTPILGGFIADRFIGQRKAVVLGGTADDDRPLPDGGAGPARAYWLGLPRGPLYGALAFIIGNGFFKPNISTMVGRLYAPGDGRRDGAFTIFYMGINLGRVLGATHLRHAG